MKPLCVGELEAKIFWCVGERKRGAVQKKKRPRTQGGKATNKYNNNKKNPKAMSKRETAKEWLE